LLTCIYMKLLRIPIVAAGLILASATAGAQDLQEIMGQVTDATRAAVYEPEYGFDIYLRVKTTEGSGQNMTIEGYLSRDGGHTAILFPGMGEKTIFVLDTRNQSVLVLSEADGAKTGFAMAVNTDALQELGSGIKDELPQDSFEQMKTGNRKEIAGYACEEYLIRDEEGETRIWTSEALGRELKQVMDANKALFGSAMVQVKGLQGMVLEFSYMDADDKVQRSMTVTSLDMNASYTVSTKDFQIMSMGQQ